MSLLPGKWVRQSLQRRLVASLTLLAYLVAAIGFPVPQGSAASSNACGQDVCGCGTAEQCKASGCACPHSSASQAETTAEDETPGDCCSKAKTTESCCVTKPTNTSAPTKTPVKPKDNTFRWVIAMSAQKCRGGQTHWLSAEIIGLPGTEPLTWQPSWPYCHSLPLIHEHSLIHTESPVVPPPRLDTV